MHKIILDGRSLTLTALADFLGAKEIQFEITKDARRRMLRARELVQDAVDTGKVVYGLTTGFGKFANVAISRENLETLQVNLVRSHSTGVGEPLSRDETRIAMLLRANALVLGFSGITLECVQTLLSMLEKDVLPIIPEQGSVGASGDLAPLAHMALSLMGEGEVMYKGRRMPSAEAMADAGIKPHRLLAKEGLALINGVQISAAIGGATALRARRLLSCADVAGAMTLEAHKGSLTPFDERIHAIRPHPGQIRTARNIRLLMKGSEILDSHHDCSRVQDCYSLRCLSQVHGAVRDCLDHTSQVLEREFNSATDNPLVFAREGDVLSGGNFHGAPVGHVMDYLALSLADLGSISERRIETLVDPETSQGLPAFLVADGGLNSGMMIPQVVAASLVSENKKLAHPATVDSIPTSANQEDHVSMSTIAARYARNIERNVEKVVAIELLCGSQGLEFVLPLKPGPGVRAAYEVIRTRVPKIECDRVFAHDILAIDELIGSGELLSAVENAVGPLA